MPSESGGDRRAPEVKPEVLLHGGHTGQRLSLTDVLLPPRTAGPPLHTHDFDEVFYVLEGRLLFQLGDTLTTTAAGEVSFAPRNVPHALANHSDAPARYLLVCAPAGFERHWARIAAEAARTVPPEWALRPLPEVTIVGPQIPATG